MSIYIKMLTDGMKAKGHQFEIWMPKARLYNLPLPGPLKKWMGYIDQFIIFPREVIHKLKNTGESIFVFSDNALGPWVPLVANRPHVIHCHDFMAQKSGIGKIAENKVSWTGRKYQDFIRSGYMAGKNFISVSYKTKSDLHKILQSEPVVSEVVYNGLNKIFGPLDQDLARKSLSEKFDIILNNGYFLHIGGNLWYKNRKGVIEIYMAWRALEKSKLPLLLVGEQANDEILKIIQESVYKDDIYILSRIDDNALRELYAGASMFIFPSLEEGFGWPIAESMACGCIVVTTDEAPMTEVGSEAAFYIPRRPYDEGSVKNWTSEAATVIENILELTDDERKSRIKAGIENAKRFDLDLNLDKVEAIYRRILSAKNE